MKELALYNISKDRRLKSIPEEQITSIVESVYSHGYLYDPYKKKFKNPFTDESINIYTMKNYTAKKLINFNERFLNTERTKEEKEFLFDLVINKTRISPILDRFMSNVDVFSVGLFIIFMMISIITYFFEFNNHIYLSVTFNALSFCFFMNYFLHQSGTEMELDKAYTSEVWKKHKTAFFLTMIVCHVILYYLIYYVVKNWWLPLITITVLRRLVGIYVLNRLSYTYWCFHGIPEVKRFINEKM